MKPFIEWLTKMLLISTLVFLAACNTPILHEPNPDWKLSDLRAYDPADAATPNMDIVAVYARSLRDEFQIRLDYLEYAELPDHDIYLALDTRHGGSQIITKEISSDILWETLILIPASGAIRVLSKNNEAGNGWGIRVKRDPVQDNVQISIDRKALHGGEFAPWSSPEVTIQAFTIPQGASSVVDKTQPVSSNGKHPSPAPVLFVFWNTLPAYNPSMTLRKWDGAHTGPLGGRHGLFNLLRTANSNDIPLALLDLKLPSALAALEYFGGIELVLEMDRRNLLTLPQVIPDSSYSPLSFNQEILDQYRVKNNFLSGEFGFSPSNSVFSADGIIPNPHPGQILFIKVKPQQPAADKYESLVYTYNGSTIIQITSDLSTPDSYQVAQDGLALELKKSLIESALDAENTSGNTGETITVMGGSLPDSTWGVPEYARLAFEYINSHPWIDPINKHELALLANSQSSPVMKPDSLDFSLPPEIQDKSKSEQILEELKRLPENDLSRAALDAFWSFYYPIHPFNQGFQELRSFYIPQLQVMIEAAKWAEEPYTRSTCSWDIDSDGVLECLLADTKSFTVIEPAGGYISFLFMRRAGTPHQIIGPFSQIITGTSDPMFWDLSQGIHADPRVIAGAFEDPDTMFDFELEPGGINLTDPGGVVSKRFKPTQNGLNIEFKFRSHDVHYETRIPVVIDPWQMFQKDWVKSYVYSSDVNGVSWEIEGGTSIEFRASGMLPVDSFIQTQNYFSDPENPNFDYPPGHFLPFPVSLITLSNQNDFTVEIQLIDK